MNIICYPLVTHWGIAPHGSLDDYFVHVASKDLSFMSWSFAF
jgi:hypothetical protein